MGAIVKIVSLVAMIIFGVAIAALNYTGWKSHSKLSEAEVKDLSKNTDRLYYVMLFMGGFGASLAFYSSYDVMRWVSEEVTFLHILNRLLANAIIYTTMIGTGAFAMYNLYLMYQVEAGKQTVAEIEWINYTVIGAATGFIFAAVVEMIDSIVPTSLIMYVAQGAAAIGAVILIINSSIGLAYFNSLKDKSSGKLDYKDPFFISCIAAIIVGVIGLILLGVLTFMGL
jgi:hypothetical protein